MIIIAILVILFAYLFLIKDKNKKNDTTCCDSDLKEDNPNLDMASENNEIIEETEDVSSYTKVREQFFSISLERYIKGEVTDQPYHFLNYKKINSYTPIIRIEENETKRKYSITNLTNHNNFAFALYKGERKYEEKTPFEKVTEWILTHTDHIMEKEIEAEKTGKAFYIIEYNEFSELNDIQDKFLYSLVEELSKRGYSSVHYEDDKDIVVQM